MKKFTFFLIILSLSVLFYSCDSSTTEPTGSSKGSIYLTSIPAGAAIWLNGTNQSKVTPDSVTNLDAGTFQITLKLSGYKDTTFSVNVTAGVKTPKNVVLTSSLQTKTFGPVRVYETTGTTASQPSGLILSTGTAVSTSNAGMDIYYNTNSTFTVHEIKSSSSRGAFFKIGNSTNLTDGIASQVKDGSWTSTMSDEETNYVFVYDADHHYSKIKITNVSSITESPAWVEIQGIYNKTADDPRF
jgi:hypothetical protein